MLGAEGIVIALTRSVSLLLQRKNESSCTQWNNDYRPGPSRIACGRCPLNCNLKYIRYDKKTASYEAVLCLHSFLSDYSRLEKCLMVRTI